MISHSVDAAMTQTPLYMLFKYVDLKKQKTKNKFHSIQFVYYYYFFITSTIFRLC